MSAAQLHAVTGAFGYTGRYIAQRLLDSGVEVIALTNSVNRANPFGAKVRAVPFDFDKPDRLTESLRDVGVLYNTYWVRFNHKLFTFADAVKNSRTLFKAAKRAGVERIVHVSITNPSEDSPLEYFSGKAKVESALKQSGVSYAILRPAVIFGGQDILINNIAWAIRTMPVMGVFGDGQYKLQPIHVEDMASLAIQRGAMREDEVVDAIGPETFTYRGLIETIGRIIGVKRPIIRAGPTLGYLVAWVMSKFVGDVMLTKDEIRGLMAGLLCTDSPSAGRIRLTEWMAEHRDTLGRKYANELSRRTNRDKAYEEL